MASIGDEIAGTRSRPYSRGHTMCGRCDEIDNQIERYNRIAKMISDEATLDGISTTITGLEAQKLALHPKPEQ